MAIQFLGPNGFTSPINHGVPAIAEHVDSFTHAAPLPRPRFELDARAEGYRAGVMDTVRAMRTGIADELEDRAQEALKNGREEVAIELFGHAARIRAAVAQ